MSSPSHSSILLSPSSSLALSAGSPFRAQHRTLEDWAREMGTDQTFDKSRPLRELVEMLNQRELLSGVLVPMTQENTVLLSRGAIHRALLGKFGQELFWERSVEHLVLARRLSALEIDGTAPINQVIHRAIARPPSEMYEPILVTMTDGSKRILDVRLLLVSQCDELSIAMEEIEKARVVADAANLAKSLFLANMSHEIRTPMTAILGFVDLLQDEEQPNARREYLGTIRRNGEHLLRLINDILDLSKIEAGRLMVERIPCDPLAILEEVFSLLNPRAVEKGLELRVEHVWPLPERIYSDPVRVRQVLVNLVGNAIKFTQQGRITVRCALDAPAAHAASKATTLAFTVIDTGPGMTAEALSNLFQPFRQADDSTTRRFGGTGLGLSISRSLARMLGGDLFAHSQLNSGSTFFARVGTGALENVRMRTSYGAAGSMPMPPAHPLPAAASTSVTPLLDVRILLAEDGTDNQRLISHVLKLAGAQVTVADNGQKALDTAWQAQQENTPFHVVLMDMQMPIMDGYTAARELRTRGYALPVVALTAHAMTDDRQKCIDAGCDDYLSKPIDRAKMIETCTLWAGHARQKHARAA